MSKKDFREYVVDFISHANDRKKAEAFVDEIFRTQHVDDIGLRLRTAVYAARDISGIASDTNAWKKSKNFPSGNKGDFFDTAEVSPRVGNDVLERVFGQNSSGHMRAMAKKVASKK